MIAGQLYESLRAERPELDEEIAAGQFGGLFDWLRAERARRSPRASARRS